MHFIMFMWLHHLYKIPRHRTSYGVQNVTCAAASKAQLGQKAQLDGMKCAVVVEETGYLPVHTAVRNNNCQMSAHYGTL